MGHRRRFMLLLTVPVMFLGTIPLEMAAQCSGAVAGLGEVSGLSGYPFQADVKDAFSTQPRAAANLAEPLTQYVARDTRGRLRIDRNMGKSKIENANSKGAEEDRHLVMICDPVTRESISLDSLRKVATVQTLYFAMTPPRTPWDPPAPEFCSRLRVRAHMVGTQIKELGHRTIEGVDAEGVLERRAVPANASGGVTSPTEIISEAETWCSEELGAMILRISSTEDAGKTRRVAIVNIRRENPDEVLFQIPPNYKVEGAKSLFIGDSTVVPLTAAQGGQTSETKTNALTNKDVLEMLRAGLSQELVVAKIKSSACNLDTSPTALEELKAANVPEEVILAMVQAPAVALPSSAQVVANVPANTESRGIQNIAPEEMWKRVTQCVFPTYPALAFNSHITGTVDIGLGISPEGEVAINSRVLDGPALLVPSAMNAINQWKFQPNVVQGVTWSRVRALVRFNADGTTAVDLAPAILADNFGDPGTPRSAAAAFPRPRPATSPECKSGNEPRFVDGAYLAGIGGIGFPSCVACPEPSYSDKARSAKISGIVVLHLVITAEGSPANIQVQRSLGYGLDEKAIKAVRKWRFKPAVGPEGKPVAVWNDIEVNFRIK